MIDQLLRADAREAGAEADVERLRWHDIEALPYHVLGGLMAAGLVYGLVEAGPALQADAVKAALVFGLLGLRRAWMGMDR